MPRTHKRGDWMPAGYFMQQVDCEKAVAVDAATDLGYMPAVWLDQRGGSAFGRNDGQDSSLARARAKGVSMRFGPFWRSQRGTRDHRARTQVFAELVLLLLILITGGIIVRSTVFRLVSVEVVGNVRLSADAVRQAASVQPGMDFLSLNDRTIATNLSHNRFLALIDVERHFPNSVTLHVYERQAEMYVRHNGLLYVMDDRGMVLEEVDDLNVQPDMVCVEGLGVRSCTMGKTVAVDDPARLDILHVILRELRAMGLSHEISSLYLDRDLNELTLMTRSGYSVRMGDTQQIHAKLRAMQLVCEYLREKQYTGGTVDVTAPETPAWLPGVTV